ncbi:MAG: hypothetical protein ACU836_15880 [Gammaproteobacteria bacterium]
MNEVIAETICPKCGYQRSDKDDPSIPGYECPSCGIIYSKFNNPSIDKTDPLRRKKRITPVKAKGRTSEEEQFIDESKKKAINLAKLALVTIFVFYYLANLPNIPGLIWAIVWPCVGAYASYTKGRDGWAGAFGGFITGPFSLYMFWASKLRVKCPSCAASIVKNTKICPHCNIDIEAFKYPKNGTIECRDCGRDISVRAITCPGCGAPTEFGLKQEKNKPSIIGIIAVMLGIIGLFVPYIVAVFLVPIAFVAAVITLILGRKREGVIALIIVFIGFFSIAQTSNEIAKINQDFQKSLRSLQSQ